MTYLAMATDKKTLCNKNKKQNKTHCPQFLLNYNTPTPPPLIP